MNDLETAVADHYDSESLYDRILAGLKANGVDLERVAPEDLAAVDEFHIGGREATARLFSQLKFEEDQHVVDVGCGIGGSARYLATAYGCRVTGIDLTPSYIETGEALTRLCGLVDAVQFHVASALDMPIEAGACDVAITLHVAMNIADRAGLYAEMARVIKPGGVLGIYDVMQTSDEPIEFPVPWAETQATSHLLTQDAMTARLDDAGFAVEFVEDRADEALEFFRQRRLAAADGPPPLGIHMLLGTTARTKLQNMVANLEAGRIAPIITIARRR